MFLDHVLISSLQALAPEANTTNFSSPAFLNFMITCSASTDGIVISTVYVIIRAVLLLPLCTYVLYLGYQKWQQQRSFTKTSHSDIFTYHTFALEVNNAVGGTVYLCGQYRNSLEMIVAGMYLALGAVPLQICLHVLTCVERYLAVVHPVLYLKLKQQGGIRIRNISIVCVWLFAFLWSGLMIVGDDSLSHSNFFCLLVISLIIISFCSFRVLCVLTHPGPGYVGGNRDSIDQSKQKAFYTILVILALLWLWFVAFLVGLLLDKSSPNKNNTGCLVLISANWFSLPSCVVLPLLFLHRAGKLACCQ